MIKSIVVAALFALLTPGTQSEDPSPRCVESRRPNCDCPMIYDPVCGCNDVTYGNACEAECAGITSYKPGVCKARRQ